VIPPGSLVMGSPGKVKRPLREIEKTTIDAYAKRYVGYKDIYRKEVASGEWRVASEEKNNAS
jgi:carbonic anhydrase/acetyltransferase-like protein (isoleucine patch superfamily)